MLLSDGAHGHLALVLIDAQCAILAAQPFVRPVFPCALAIPAGTTAPMAAVMKKEAHQEAICLFREVQVVGTALVQEIIQTVEAPYLSSVHHRDSNSLRGSVYDISKHLLEEVHGLVSPQMLEDGDNNLCNMWSATLNNPSTLLSRTPSRTVLIFPIWATKL
jgi:hypothetical protein